MATEGVSGTAVAVVAGGLLFVWSGFKGAKVTDTLRSLLSGTNPSAADAYPITTPIAPPVATSPGLGSSPAPLSKTSPGGTGGTLSAGQIGSLWVMAGGNPSKTSGAVCIAMHESTGRTAVTSPNPDGGINVGLWQLDTPGGKGAGFTVAQLQNGLTNARVAVKGSSNGTDWSAWSTAGACGV